MPDSPEPSSPATPHGRSGESRTAPPAVTPTKSAEGTRLDRLAALVRRLLRATSCQIALVDDELQVVGGDALPAGQEAATLPLDDTVCRLVSAEGRPVRIADTRADPRTRTLPAVLAGDVRSYLGVPLVGANGRPIGTLCVFERTPREWTNDEEGLLTALAGSVVPELELAALTEQYELERAVWEIAVDAGGIGTFDLDVGSGELHWDDRMVGLFGYTRAEFDNLLSGAFERIHPDDLPRVEATVERALADGTSYADEYRVLLPGGQVRWLASRGRVLSAADGSSERLIGAAYDITAMREASERLAATLDGMSVGYLWLDPDWVIAYANGQAVATLGVRDDELIGRTIWSAFPAVVGSVFETNYRHVAETGETITFDAYYPAPLDAWYEIRATPEHGGVALYFLDVTARMLARQDAEHAAARAELLSALSEQLSEGDDVDTALTALPDLLVPVLCDWCIVTVLDSPAADDAAARASRVIPLRDVGAGHHDARRVDLLDRFVAARMTAFRDEPQLPAMTLRAARSGETSVLRRDATAITLPMLPEGPSRELLSELAPEAVAVLPLRARGRTLALITLGWDGAADASSGTGPAAPVGPTDNDLATLELVADRAGVALDNARLNAAQRSLAEALQRSLLTDPPTSEHLQVVVRYLPAAESAQVGGDWYDAFLQPDGSTCLVIGDVLGHDTRAAAVMGQIRTLVRAAAVITGHGPADVLRTADAAARTLRVGTFATAVVARVETADDGGFALRWSNAGHPPPVIVEPNGAVRALDAGRPNMLLGVDPAAARDEHTEPLPAGSCVLMYTDGLVERRDQPVEVGIARLRAVLDDLRGHDLDELCDAVLDRLLDGQRSDDVAVIAMRVG